MLLTTAFCVWLVVKGRPELHRHGTAGAVNACISLAFTATVAIGRWKVFEKAGQPGWGAIIPVYNLFLLLRVARRPWWWLFLYAIPVANLIPLIFVPLAVARNFGKSGLFGVGLMILGFIFYPVLGFGDAQYRWKRYPIGLGTGYVRQPGMGAEQVTVSNSNRGNLVDGT